MEFFNNHKLLFITSGGFFVFLTIFVAIVPALNNQRINKPLPGDKPLTATEMRGKYVYIAEGCVGCHTQQVRSLDMDKMWGPRPNVAADYALYNRMDTWRNTATLMGTERTGPDLTNIGNRQPSIDWQLLHLFQPRAVVKESIMPSYAWLFQYKEKPGPNDKVVNVPAEYMKGRKGKIVAKQKALDLVAYLLSRKMVDLPTGVPTPGFLYARKKAAENVASGGGTTAADGAALYTSTCQACHQANGEGLPGAFPSLKGSSIVTGDDLNTYVSIIMNGYNGRATEGYGPMPPIGTTNKLTPEEVTAIMNHERTNWGNNAKEVTVDEIKKLMDAVKQ